MPAFTFQQPILQLEKRQGGYYHLVVAADIVDQFDRKRTTRLVCTIDRLVSFSCGLNHLGDGNFYLILSTANLKILGKNAGDPVSFEITEDPNPLGVDIPEVLQVLLDQDEVSERIFNELTDGKKRSLIYSIRSVKDVDKQIRKILDFLSQQKVKSR